jgi:hypothetical protein
LKEGGGGKSIFWAAGVWPEFFGLKYLKEETRAGFENKHKKKKYVRVLVLTSSQ